MVTLSSDPLLASRAVELIDAQNGLECGERHDRWLAVAVESRDDREARERHAWLEKLSGVDRVDVILVTLDETSP